jgi:multisubunit Na+/H+ antiporter MnhE subunit
MIGKLVDILWKSLNLTVLFFYFCWKIIEAGWTVGILILNGYKGDNGIEIAYKPQLKNPWLLILLFNLISMTPGSLSVDWDNEKSEINVHLLNGKDIDEFYRVTTKIEKILLRSFT